MYFAAFRYRAVKFLEKYGRIFVSGTHNQG